MLLTVTKACQYYRAAEPQPAFPTHERAADDTLRVLFTGDSWAAYHSDHDTTLARMITEQTGMTCRVTSAGNVGAKSREVYERLFGSNREHVASRPDVCIVSAGINDAVAKMGARYYAANYSAIIRLLLDLQITPVVIDMPDVDYRAVYAREGLVARGRHRLSALITGADMFSFSEYRSELRTAIDQNAWADSIIYICSRAWMPDIDSQQRNNMMLPDAIHMTRQGYLRLDSCIAVEINLHYRKR